MSSEPNASPHWPRVADLRLRLRPHVHVYPQDYRGERWYVLRDEARGQFLRFNALAYELIGRFDGELTVEEIWSELGDALADDALRQDEVVQILAQLVAADALRGHLSAEARQFFASLKVDTPRRRHRAVMNPLAIRVPLIDPDRFVALILPWARPAMSWAGALVWLTVVGLAAVLALSHTSELASAVNAGILSPANIALMWLMFPAMKVAHELGHALAIKMWGGEVHEMGITLLVLVPVPYVDASAAWAFRDRRKRVLVGAAGVVVELFLASAALFVWLAVEPGLLRDAALDAVLIGTVSTVFFNGNPLLRFDAYYVLQDLIEIPNLYARSARYYIYLIQRYGLGLENARSPVAAAGERRWFFFYGCTSFVFRLFMLVAIALYLAAEYLVIGVALATFAVATQIVLPLWRATRFLIAAPTLVGRRLRAGVAACCFVGVAGGAVTLIPAPMTTHAEGVVWLPDRAHVYTDTNGFVADMLVADGTPVEAGTVLIRMVAPSLATRLAVTEARHRELTLRKAAERVESRTQSEITEEELASVSAELELLREREAALQVRSPVNGTFVLADALRIGGTYLAQGALVGYVIDPERLIVRSVVPQSDIDLVRARTDRAEVRLAERVDRVHEARIVREVPMASETLPSRALGAASGGEIAVDAADAKGVTATDKIFQLDLALPADIAVTAVGGRAYVRFEHGAQPLARQWLRGARQLVLSKLSF